MGSGWLRGQGCRFAQYYYLLSGNGLNPASGFDVDSGLPPGNAFLLRHGTSASGVGPRPLSMLLEPFCLMHTVGL